MRPRKLVKCFLGLGSILVSVVLLGGSKLLFAQTSSGKVQGTVTDPTHAALFDVIITVTNSETGFSRQVESDEYGRFTIGGLPPGIYTINAKRSEEHTSELQSRPDLVCRLLLEKKKTHPVPAPHHAGVPAHLRSYLQHGN